MKFTKIWGVVMAATLTLALATGCGKDDDNEGLPVKAQIAVLQIFGLNFFKKNAPKTEQKR